MPMSLLSDEIAHEIPDVIDEVVDRGAELSQNSLTKRTMHDFLKDITSWEISSLNNKSPPVNMRKAMQQNFEFVPEYQR